MGGIRLKFDYGEEMGKFALYGGGVGVKQKPSQPAILAQGDQINLPAIYMISTHFCFVT